MYEIFQSIFQISDIRSGTREARSREVARREKSDGLIPDGRSARFISCCRVSMFRGHDANAFDKEEHTSIMSV